MYENRIRILNGQILDTKKTIGKSLEQRFWISFTLDQKTGWFSGTKKKVAPGHNKRFRMFIRPKLIFEEKI